MTCGGTWTAPNGGSAWPCSSCSSAARPDGTRQTGRYTTWPGSSVGSRVTVWAGPGTVSLLPPRRHPETITRTGLAVTGVTLTTGALLFGLYQLARRRYDQRRDQLWDAAWAHLDNHRIR